MATVQEILQADWNPTFSFRPGADAPLPPDVAFSRGSSAWTFDENRDLVKRADGESRIFGPKQPLRIEPQRTQVLSSPASLASADWSESGVNVTGNAGTSKTRLYDEIVEDTSSGAHDVDQTFSRQTEGQLVAGSVVVNPNGRRWLNVAIRINDDDASDNEYEEAFFDLSNGQTGVTQGFSNATLLEQTIIPLGGDWWYVKLVFLPDPAWATNQFKLRLSNGDGVDTYTGDGSSSILVLAVQLETSRQVTTPILSSGATRNADSVTIDKSTLSDEEMTFLVEFDVPSAAASNTARVLNDSSDNRINLLFDTEPYKLRYATSADGELMRPTAEFNGYERVRVALSVSRTKARMAVNGVSDTTNASPDLLVSPEDLEIASGTVPINLYNISSAPELLSTTALESLTSVV